MFAFKQRMDMMMFFNKQIICPPIYLLWSLTYFVQNRPWNMCVARKYVFWLPIGNEEDKQYLKSLKLPLPASPCYLPSSSKSHCANKRRKMYIIFNPGNRNICKKHTHTHISFDSCWINWAIIFFFHNKKVLRKLRYNFHSFVLKIIEP